MKVIGSVVLGMMAAALITGCESGGSSDNSVTTIAVGAQAPQGSPLDAGSEVPDSATAAEFWGDIPPRMGVMCQANVPPLVEGGSDNYNPEIVAEAGALTFTANDDGTLTATASDFISPRGSGLVWKFAGFQVIGGTNPILTTNPLVLQPGDQKDTFHVYWNSYEPAE